MSIKFDPGSALGKQLAEFLAVLRKEPGARAELRRCDDVAEVMMTPVYHRFCQRIRGLFEGERDWEPRMAMVVGLMAHLKRDEPSRVLETNKGLEKSYAGFSVAPMAALKGDRPTVSELRFRRLLQRESDDLYPSMIRVLRMVDGNVNLYGLAESVYYWGVQVKKDWSFAYFPRVPERKSA